MEGNKIAGFNNSSVYKDLLVRFSLLLEAMNISPLLDYFEFDALFIINYNHVNDVDDKDFLYFAKLQSTILKYSFDALVKSLDANETAIFPLSIEQVVNYASELRGQLLKFLEKCKKIDSNFDCYMFVSSLLELHYRFSIRPMLIENGERALYVKQPKMEKNHFHKIISLVEAAISKSEDEVSVTSEILKVKLLKDNY